MEPSYCPLVSGRGRATCSIQLQLVFKRKPGAIFRRASTGAGPVVNCVLKEFFFPHKTKSRSKWKHHSWGRIERALRDQFPQHRLPSKPLRGVSRRLAQSDANSGARAFVGFGFQRCLWSPENRNRGHFPEQQPCLPGLITTSVTALTDAVGVQPACSPPRTVREETFSC